MPIVAPSNMRGAQLRSRACSASGQAVFSLPPLAVPLMMLLELRSRRSPGMP